MRPYNRAATNDQEYSKHNHPKVAHKNTPQKSSINQTHFEYITSELPIASSRGFKTSRSLRSSNPRNMKNSSSNFHINFSPFYNRNLIIKPSRKENVLYSEFFMSKLPLNMWHKHCASIRKIQKILNFYLCSRIAFDKISQKWVEIVNFKILQWPVAPKTAKYAKHTPICETG